MILTAIIAIATGFVIGAACFIAGCIYWDANCPAPHTKTVCITDEAVKILEKNNAHLYVGKSMIKDNALIFHTSKPNDRLEGTPLIIYDPKTADIDILG